MARVNVPAELAELARAFARRGWPLYAVGGWCRDLLLNLPAYDADVCGPTDARSVMDGFAGDSALRVFPQAEALGTVLLLLESGTRVEYTAFRRESYRDASHRPSRVELGASLPEDALRRDFTVNALYVDLLTGDVLDPTSGLNDLALNRLRTPREPAAVFAEDGLRLMRLARLAAELGFSIEENTFAAAAAGAAGIDAIAPQRVGQEMNRLLLADTRHPSRARGRLPVLEGLTILDDLGVLDHILPEVTAGRGVIQRPEYHDFNVLGHLLRSCALASASPALRWAALLHDIGKPVVAPSGTMVGHDRIGAAMVPAILDRMACGHELRDQVRALVRYHMYDLDGRTREGKLRRFFARRGYVISQELIELRRADVAGSRAQPPSQDPAARWARILARMQAEGVPDCVDGVALSGRDIAALLGEVPSPRVGRMKQALWRYVIDHPGSNHPAELTRVVARLQKDPRQWDCPIPQED